MLEGVFLTDQLPGDRRQTLDIGGRELRHIGEVRLRPEDRIKIATVGHIEGQRPNARQVDLKACRVKE